MKWYWIPHKPYILWLPQLEDSEGRGNIIFADHSLSLSLSLSNGVVNS